MWRRLIEHRRRIRRFNRYWAERHGQESADRLSLASAKDIARRLHCWWMWEEFLPHPM